MKRIITFLMLAGLVTGIQAQTSELIISEYVEGWSNNKALEIYNPNDFTVDLGEFRIVRYSNGEDVPPAEDKWVVVLPSESLEPFNTYVLVIDQRNPDGTGQTAPVWSQLQQRADAFLCPDYNVSEAMYFNGDDAIVIEKDEGGGEYIIHDIFGRWGPPAPAEAQFVNSTKVDNAWTDVAPYFTGEGYAVTAEHTMIRKSNIGDGVKENPTVFNPLQDWDTLYANTFFMLGWHEYDNAPANETPVITNEKLAFAVSPSASNGTEVATITASDAEGDPLKFYMDYGNFIYIDDVRVEPFELNEETGVISLVDETGLAPEVLDTFNISLNITDGYSQLGPVNIRIIVTDDELGIDNEFQSSLKVYPNPATEGFFRVSSELDMTGIELCNTIGQTVYSAQYSDQVFETEVNTGDLSRGFYLLRIRYSSGATETVKLLLD